MGRSPCCAKEGLNRGAWTATEDKILTDYIKLHGEGKWRKVPKRAGLMRCGKSCRLRWLNYLSPNIKRGNITHDEEDLIIRLHKLLGNRWSLIAGRLPGRTDNEIKNYWNTNICKKMQVQPNSSTNPKSLNQQKSSPIIDADQKISPIIDEPKTNTESSSVVRTKASRCTTKILITPAEAEETLQNSFCDRVVGGPGQPFNAMEDDDSLDFAIEFDQMDKNLLSDFLNSDFHAPLHGFENGLETGDPGSSSSPNSDHTLLFASDQMMLCDLDLQSMAYDHLPDTSIYWLHDQ